MTLVIIMGVSGSGKTTVGKLLAEKNHWQFKDADAFHALKNRFKMQQGKALTDHDRSRWLSALSQAIATWNKTSQSTVLACSALKQQYRQQLVPADISAHWIYLKGDYEEIYPRLCDRQRAGHHFMHPDLLKSQFEILEEPKNALTLEVTQSAQEIVSQIEAHIKTQ